jgi:hypothetical protein
MTASFMPFCSTAWSANTVSPPGWVRITWPLAVATPVVRLKLTWSA